MNKCNEKSEKHQYCYTSAIPLVAIGTRIRELKMFEPIEKRVQIAQKTVKHRPVDKLMDAYIALLSGAQGMVEVNKRVRAERALQIAFGRKGCAEQSVVQGTLDACNSKNVEGMENAIDKIYQLHSQGYRHDYQHEYQLIDIDMTGRPCGRKAALASKGYFAKQRNRRGRQEGYVLATWYEELVIARLYNGKTQLNTALKSLIEAAEKCLDLDEGKRKRTLLRIDSGGGSLEDVNWILERGYQIHCKDYSGKRATHLAESVTEWVVDPKDPQREYGWVTLDPVEYSRPVRRIAVRCRKANGQWAIGVIISSLEPEDILRLAGFYDQDAALEAYVQFYDLRGGGVEIEIKEDKQGLGNTKRNKKSFEAQEMLVQLEVLAHNTLVWARLWLADRCYRIAHFGLKRFIRDVLHLNGLVVLDSDVHILQLILNPLDPFADVVLPGLAALLAQEHVAACLGEI